MNKGFCRQSRAVTSRPEGRQSLVSYQYEEELQDDNKIVISVDLLRELTKRSPGIPAKSPVKVSVHFQGQNQECCTKISRQDFDRHMKREKDSNLATNIDRDDGNWVNWRHCHTTCFECKHSDDGVVARHLLKKRAALGSKQSQSLTSLYSLTKLLNQDQCSRESQAFNIRYRPFNTSSINWNTRPHISGNGVALYNHVAKNRQSSRVDFIDDPGPSDVGLIGSEVRRMPAQNNKAALPLLSGKTCKMHIKSDDVIDARLSQKRVRARTAFVKTPSLVVGLKPASTNKGNINVTSYELLTNALPAFVRVREASKTEVDVECSRDADYFVHED